MSEVRVPAHVRPYVDVLGVDKAVDFLLRLGGGVSYFSLQPALQSPIAQVVGVEKAAALAKVLGDGSRRVPTAKPFIARVLRSRGRTASEIARLLHVSDVAVRGWTTEDTRQLKLFEA